MRAIAVLAKALIASFGKVSCVGARYARGDRGPSSWRASMSAVSTTPRTTMLISRCGSSIVSRCAILPWASICSKRRPGAAMLQLSARRDLSQRALSWSIAAPGRRLEQIDAHGNIAHLLTIEEPHREISIVVRGVVETADIDARQDDGPLSPLAYRSEERR